MNILLLVVAPDKAEFESYLRLELFNIEVPVFHIFLRRYGLPYRRNGRIVDPFENNGFRGYRLSLHVFFFLVVLLVFFAFRGGDAVRSRNSPSASSFLVQNTLYCSDQSATSLSP